MPAIKVLVRHQGPLPSEQPVRGIVQRHIRTMKDDLGAHLVHEVQTRTDRFFVNPTGHYRSQVDYLINQGNGAVIVHDRGVVYGPWLEGTSRRNAETRFKGYRIFRQVMQATQAQVDQVAAREVSVMCKELS